MVSVGESVDTAILTTIMNRLLRSLIILVSSLTVLVLSFAQCTKDIIDTTGDIAGVVRDSRSNEPLNGVTVSITPTGKSMTTGADGRYEFKGLTAQSNYTVSVSKNGYQSDQKSAFIVAGETSNVDFTITPSQGQLELSQKTLDFGNQNTTLAFDVINKGNATLNWEISEDVSWLSCSPTSGSIDKGGKATVIVNVKREGLERGTYSQTIAVSSNGGSEVMRVDMAVQGLNMTISPETLDFGSVTSSMQMTMSNNGTGSISYTLKPNKDWVKLNKTTGSFSSSEVVTVSVNREGFSEGNYEASIEIRINDENRSVDVRMNIPSKEKPTVSLISVSDETYNSAVFKGAVVSVGSSKVTARGFCWSTKENPDLEQGYKCNLGDCETAEDFSYTSGSLESSTEYYVRAYAQNIEGVCYSNQLKFSTKGTPKLSEVETGAVSDIQSKQALANGNILNLGNVSEVIDYGHVWSQKENPTIYDNKNSLGSTSSTGTYNTTLTGLEPNKTYHVRAFATNSVGTSYGKDVTFSTSLGDLEMQTTNVSDITYNSAICGGNVTESGGHKLAECGICYDYNLTPTINSNVLKSSVVSASFKVNLSGLKESTTYLVRAYVKTESGNLYYGNTVKFTTADKDVNIGIGSFGDDKNWTR